MIVRRRTKALAALASLATAATGFAVVAAPAGTIGGFHGFLGRIVSQATESGLLPVVITDRAVPDAALGKVRLDGGRWLFDLDDTTTTDRTPPPRRPRRRRS